jgi:hypothetical protein
VILLQTPGGYWSFVQPGPDEAELHAAPLSAEEVRALLTALVALGRPEA